MHHRIDRQRLDRLAPLATSAAPDGLRACLDRHRRRVAGWLVADAARTRRTPQPSPSAVLQAARLRHAYRRLSEALARAFPSDGAAR